MIDIEEYILLSKEERQQHLKLETPCIERGGQSMYCKGLVAHLRDTTIPSGKKIHVCHACHNAKCSNPDHLYWGTPKENRQDATDNGAVSIWDRMVAKHGLEIASQMQSRKSTAHLGGLKNKGKTVTQEVRKKISNSLLANKTKKKSTGRPAIMPPEELVRLVDTNGYQISANLLNIPVDTLRYRYYNAKKKL